MDNKFVITIGREYGSGGRVIGQAVAERLGIKFYDDEIIELISKESGLSIEAISKLDGTKTSSFLYNAFMSTQSIPLNDEIFLAQSRVIKELAAKESCVIVSRCADYVLRDYKNLFNIFIYAPMEARIERTKSLYHDIANNYESYVKKMDKKRADYYNYFTPNKWGERCNYHMMIDSSVGIENTVNMLAAMVCALFGGEN